MKKLDCGFDSWMKKFSWGENPERYLPGRCVFTIIIIIIIIIIYNSDDTTQSPN